MFIESLLESSGAPRHTNRRWTTAASLALQVMVLSALAVVPMLYPDALSLMRRPPDIPIFSSAPQPAPNTPAHNASAAPTSHAIFVPAISTLHYGPPRPTADFGDPPPPGIQSNLSNLTIPLNPPAVHVAPPAQPTRPLIVSHVNPADLVHSVQPVYPQAARQVGIQGPVVLHALISKEGAIESLQVVSGHPFLARAALDAVRQWRYRPYLLNGQPVEVETQITVNFILGKE